MNETLLMEDFQAIKQLETDLNRWFYAKPIVARLSQEISQSRPVLLHYNVEWTLSNLAVADHLWKTVIILN